MDDLFKSSGTKIKPSAIVLGLAAIVIFGVMLGLYWYAKKSHTVFDPDTLCPKEGHKLRTVVLLDTSDPLSVTQQQRVSQLARDFRDPTLSRNEMEIRGTPGLARYIEPLEEIAVYELVNRTPPVNEVLRVCNPGNPEQESDLVKKATSNARRQLGRWRKFEETILSAFPKERFETEATRSPILEAISYLGASQAGSIAQKLSSPDSETRFVLISDFIQHSSLFSQYRDYPSWDRAQAELRGTDAYAELQRIDFILFYARRSEYRKLQSDAHKRWWLQAIKDMGGNILHFEQF